MSSFPDDTDVVALVLAKLPLSELLRACAVCRLWADTGKRAVEERQPLSMYQPQLTCGSNFRVGEVVDAFVRVEGTGSMVSGCSYRRRMSDAQGTWKRGTIVELEPTAAKAALKAEALTAKKEAALIKSEAAAAGCPPARMPPTGLRGRFASSSFAGPPSFGRLYLVVESRDASTLGRPEASS